jgi:hypothetical protein
MRRVAAVPPWQIFVSTLTGKNITLDVYSCSKISE